MTTGSLFFYCSWIYSPEIFIRLLLANVSNTEYCEMLCLFFILSAMHRWNNWLFPLPSDCSYLFSLSGALVILNVVPCYALDGQWILQALIDLCLTGYLPCRRKRRIVFRFILFLGTLLLCGNLVFALSYFLLDANIPDLRLASLAAPGHVTVAG